MGWNVLALFVSGVTADEAVAEVGPAEHTGRTVEADEATAGRVDDLVYAAESGGWAQVWTPSLEVVERFEPGEQSALRAFFGSVSGVYGFTYFEDGEFVRQVIYMDREVAVDQGDPLAFEATITVGEWGPDEDYVWTVIESVTGTGWQPDLRYGAYRLDQPPSTVD